MDEGEVPDKLTVELGRPNTVDEGLLLVYVELESGMSPRFTVSAAGNLAVCLDGVLFSKLAVEYGVIYRIEGDECVL